jgi:hypothetical protein
VGGWVWDLANVRGVPSFVLAAPRLCLCPSSARGYMLYVHDIGTYMCHSLL